MTGAIGRFFDSLSTIPKPIRSFLQRALLIVIVWKVLYLGFWAYPRTLDAPLTNLVGEHSAWMLNQLTGSSEYSARPYIYDIPFEGEIQVSPVSRIDKNGEKILHIADGCNGLELFVLYVGFLLAMPASARRKLLFIVAGMAIIHAVNVLRCAGLCILIQRWREHFDLAHHYIFKVMIYSVIFLLWVKFSQKITFTKEPDHAV
jgi:exosortase family protein XrtF